MLGEIGGANENSIEITKEENIVSQITPKLQILLQQHKKNCIKLESSALLQSFLIPMK